VLLRKFQMNSFCVKLRRNRSVQGNQVTCESFCLCEEKLNRKRSLPLARSLYLNLTAPQCWCDSFQRGSEESTRVHFARSCTSPFARSVY